MLVRYLGVDNADNPSDLEVRMNEVERSMETMSRYFNRVNGELLGYLLVLCLPMSNKRRMQLAAAILGSKDLENETLKEILDRYFKEGKKSEITFDDLLDPIIEHIGFEKLWKILDAEYIKSSFGELAFLKWKELEKNAPCKEEVRS